MCTGLGQYISGAILFDETLFQKGADGKQFVDILMAQVGRNFVCSRPVQDVI